MLFSSYDASLFWLIAVLAFVIDLAFGDPSPLYRRLWHPVVVMGKALAWLERKLNPACWPRSWRLVSGVVVSLGLVACAAMAGYGLHAVLATLPGGWIIEAVLASSLLAFKGLHDHIRPVYAALARGDLLAARRAVSMVVGRRTQSLDAAGVSRAGIESLAENYADGGIAPLFWYLLAGLPGLFAYKMLNTQDSMIGHRSMRYEAFGKTAARLDDLANWLPARLTAGLFACVGLWLGKSPLAVWKATKAEAPKHASPNAGWPEGAMAALLGTWLAGPRDYGSYRVEGQWIGPGPWVAEPATLGLALQVTRQTNMLVLALVLGGWLASLMLG